MRAGRVVALLLFAFSFRPATARLKGPSSLAESPQSKEHFRARDAASRELFAGEDVVHGNPWHHEDITKEALALSGFDDGAIRAIAWHADFTDSYNYNPLWWFEPMINQDFSISTIRAAVGRFKAAMSIIPDLNQVHFDDLGTADKVVTAYYRYMTGSLVGLYWAADIAEGEYSENIDPVGAAHNIIGVTFHAIQDFYSHSNWIDDKEHRDKTFLDYSVPELKKQYLYTGWYEGSSVKPHGKPSVLCSLISKGGPLDGFLPDFLNLICKQPVLPKIDDICYEYNQCKGGNSAPVEGGKVLGVAIPDDTLYYLPPGINLDNTWQADIGVQVRGIDDEMTGLEAFTLARSLAVRASREFIDLVGAIMTEEGYGSFWRAVKKEISSQKRTNEFEKFNHFPFQFFSTGPFKSTDDGYYLRTIIKTSSSTFSGTDADIVLEAGGQSFLLNYMPEANPLIAYNDFESGDETVYTLGPFSSLPSSIRIKNDAPDLKEIWKSLINDLKLGFKRGIDALVGLFTNDADRVGENTFVMEPDFLRAIDIDSSVEGRVHINGGSSGKYNIIFAIEHLLTITSDVEISRAHTTGADSFIVTIKRMRCIQESNEWDLNWSDEPFIMARLDSYPGNSDFIMTKKFENFDKGDTKQIGRTFQRVDFEEGIGAMVLTFVLMESDREDLEGRRKLFREFKGIQVKEEFEFFESIGESIAEGLKLDWIKVFAFRRGDNIQAGQVLFDDTDRWIDGGKSISVALDSGGMKSRRSFNEENKVKVCDASGFRGQCKLLASDTSFPCIKGECESIVIGSSAKVLAEYNCWEKWKLGPPLAQHSETWTSSGDIKHQIDYPKNPTYFFCLISSLKKLSTNETGPSSSDYEAKTCTLRDYRGQCEILESGVFPCSEKRCKSIIIGREVSITAKYKCHPKGQLGSFINHAETWTTSRNIKHTMDYPKNPTMYSCFLFELVNND